MTTNERLMDRVRGLQGAATSAGPEVLREWSLLHEGAAEGEVSFVQVKDFQTRLGNMTRQNRLDETLSQDRRRMILPEPSAPDSELLQLEKAASQACGMWIGRDETKPRR